MPNKKYYKPVKKPTGMKMYVLKETDIEKLNKLMTEKKDNQYIVIRSNGLFTDIAQYSSKYDDIHIVTTRTINLNETNQLVS